MTATRDRRSDPAQDAELAWDERSILGKSRGLPWWGAVLLAFGLAAIAAAFDMQRQDSLGRVFQGAYFVGCVAAICLVRRRSLFGPIVQPPLVFAITAIAAVVLLAPDTAGGSGLKWLLFSVALPLTSNFLTMAITTAVTVAIGVFRIWRERDPESPGKPVIGRERPGKDRVPPARSRRAEPDAADLDDAEEPRPRRRGAPDPGASRRGERRGGADARRGDAPRREPGRRGDSRRDPDDPRRGRRSDAEGGRVKGERPDADPEDEPRRAGLRGRSTREARGDQSPRDRAAADRSRSRSRDAAQPRRRESGADRPRRDDRSRRDPEERGARRRPQDPYR